MLSPDDGRDRQPNGELRVGAWFQGDGAVVVGDDLAADGQAEPGAAGVAAAAGVVAGEPLEDPLPLVVGDAGTVVGDR